MITRSSIGARRGKFAHVAVNARAVGARASSRAGLRPPVSRPTDPARALRHCPWRSQARIARSWAPFTRTPARPDGPHGPVKTDRPESKLLPVICAWTRILILAEGERSHFWAIPLDILR